MSDPGHEDEKTRRLKESLGALTTAQLVDRLDLALEGAGLGIWDWDLRDDAVQFDRRWCEMIGLDHAATPMRLETWRDRVHADDLEPCYRDIRAHLEGRSARYENVHRMRHADGSWVYILDRGRVSERDAEGRPVRFTGTHFDVTAVEKAKQSLANQRRQLERLVANLPTGVLMLDREGRVLAASERWPQRVDGGVQRLRGRRFDEALPDAARWSDAFARALEGERVHADEELVSDPDGSLWLRWEARPWHTADGATGGVLLCAEDVSERVRQRVAVERERETRVASLALFAGSVAHELNTPLQVIVLEADLLARRLGHGDANKVNLDGLRGIAETARRAGEITRALRTLSRDAQHDPATAVPAAELLRDAMALCRARFEGHGVALSVRDSSGSACARGRPAELLVVLMNLLHNALDAVSGAEAPWVRLEAEADAETVRVRCVDSGGGVSAELARKIMEPFFTTKPPGEGTGLGLAIAQALAARDGGALRYCEGQAHTTFELTVPRH